MALIGIRLFASCLDEQGDILKTGALGISATFKKESDKFVKTGIMTTISIRQKLHNYLELADDKKVKAMYTILEEDIEEFSVEYSDELKNELDKRLEDLKNGKTKSISAKDSKKRIEKIMKSGKR